ncbi:universal stress protein [Peterkaempfera griseoplana]|uniref:universal stress protein n=1 Tax=Peterkaempfera griseoplana TaxID=66896 RepID=UPI0006E34B72|nr:universal stress protein [Peterkaempfera griseoplana]
MAIPHDPVEQAELPVSEQPPNSPPSPGILAAVDGSDGSLWALDRAMTEAELFRLPLYVLSVVNPSPGGYTLGMADIVQEGVERLLVTMRESLRRSVATVQDARARPYAGPISLHVVLGNVVETVLAASARHHTLVMGTRGNGGFARLLLGSVSTAAVHHAACPVLIVPAPPEPAGGAEVPD